MNKFTKWVNDIPTLIKVGVVTGTILATILGAWSVAPKSTSSGDTPVMLQLLEAQQETNRTLWRMNENLIEIKTRLSK